jgi:hypothetical protein
MRGFAHQMPSKHVFWAAGFNRYQGFIFINVKEE